MDTQWKYSANAGFFGMRRDRFNKYQPARSLEEVFAAVASVPGIRGIELKYPSDFADMGLVRELLDQHELTLCAVNVDTKDFAEFSRGALSAIDEKTRRVAIDRLKDAMDIAAEFKTPYITTCPLSDGYDYPFEIDYGIAWESFIDSIKSAVAHRDDVTLLLEYQPREPFSRIMLSDVGKLLMVCAEVAAPNLGANLDIGHAFAAGDTPAEAAALLARAGRLHYIHSNDNTGDGGDWDMISGSVHFGIGWSCCRRCNRWVTMAGLGRTSCPSAALPQPCMPRTSP